eukprot:1160178-Pelagomonas_calceolata.AAC.8
MRICGTVLAKKANAEYIQPGQTHVCLERDSGLAELCYPARHLCASISTELPESGVETCPAR